jgi:hypothetical protein
VPEHTSGEGLAASTTLPVEAPAQFSTIKVVAQHAIPLLHCLYPGLSITIIGGGHGVEPPFNEVD